MENEGAGVHPAYGLWQIHAAIQKTWSTFYFLCIPQTSPALGHPHPSAWGHTVPLPSLLFSVRLLLPNTCRPCALSPDAWDCQLEILQDRQSPFPGAPISPGRNLTWMLFFWECLSLGQPFSLSNEFLAAGILFVSPVTSILLNIRENQPSRDNANCLPICNFGHYLQNLASNYRFPWQL